MREDSAPAPATPGPGWDASAAVPPFRDTAMDALRTVAVLLMVASHTSRLIAWDERREWSRFSLVIEPFTASLFLILVGASLVQSWRKAVAAGTARSAWLRRQGLRALALWALSAVFYTLSEGFLLPDAVVLSGILCTIAYTAAAGSLLVSGSRPVLHLALAAGAMAALYAWLDLGGRRVFVLNAGNSPLLPLSLFGLLGALGALAVTGGAGARHARLLLAGAAVMALAFLLSRHSFRELFTKPLGRYETARVFQVGPPEAGTVKSIPYYNLRLILAPAILSLAVLLYAFLAAARPVLDRCSAWLLRLGRRSLDVYILHLVILAAFVVAAGKRPLKETWQGDAVYLGVVSACYLWAWGRDAFRSRRRAGFR